MCKRARALRSVERGDTFFASRLGEQTKFVMCLGNLLDVIFEMQNIVHDLFMSLGSVVGVSLITKRISVYLIIFCYVTYYILDSHRGHVLSFTIIFYLKKVYVSISILGFDM
jgi:hypothetical protein